MTSDYAKINHWLFSKCERWETKESFPLSQRPQCLYWKSQPPVFLASVPCQEQIKAEFVLGKTGDRCFCVPGCAWEDQLMFSPTLAGPCSLQGRVGNKVTGTELSFHTIELLALYRRNLKSFNFHWHKENIPLLTTFLFPKAENIYSSAKTIHYTLLVCTVSMTDWCPWFK